MFPEYFEFSLPTKLIYGIGVLRKIENIIKPFGLRKAILVTDKILVKAGPVGKVKEGFKGSNIDIVCTYDKVPPNSTIDVVEGCALMAKEKRLQYDYCRWRRECYRYGQGGKHPYSKGWTYRGPYGGLPS